MAGAREVDSKRSSDPALSHGADHYLRAVGEPAGVRVLTRQAHHQISPGQSRVSAGLSLIFIRCHS